MAAAPEIVAMLLEQSAVPRVKFFTVNRDVVAVHRA